MVVRVQGPPPQLLYMRIPPSISAPSGASHKVPQGQGSVSTHCCLHGPYGGDAACQGKTAGSAAKTATNGSTWPFVSGYSNSHLLLHVFWFYKNIRW